MAKGDVNKPSKKGCHNGYNGTRPRYMCCVCERVCVCVCLRVCGFFFVCLRSVCKDLWWIFGGSLSIAVLGLVWIRWIIHCFCTNICPNLTEQSHVFLQFLFSWEKERTKCTACTCILNTLWKRGGGRSWHITLKYLHMFIKQFAVINSKRWHRLYKVIYFYMQYYRPFVWMSCFHINNTRWIDDW